MPGGRPSTIDAVVGYRDVDGERVEITIADRIVASLRAGLFLEPAIAGSGAGKETVYGWIREAGRLRKEYRGDFTTAQLTDHQRRCIEFSDAVDEADGLWEVDSNTLLERLGRGGIPQVTTTIKRGPAPRGEHGEQLFDEEGRELRGAILEETTKTAHTLPDAETLKWRLTRRHPDRYAQRLELSGPGGGPLELSQEERARSLLAQIRRTKSTRAERKAARAAKAKPPTTKKEPTE